MPFIICRTCKKTALVEQLKADKKETKYAVKSYPGGCGCGTDQRRGKVRQDYIKSHMVDSIDELSTQVLEPVQDKPKPTELKPEEEKPPAGKKSYSKLWWLLIPVAGLGYTFAKMAGAKNGK